jgi:ATP-binding cassette subfamily B protein
MALVAVLGEALADILGPWPIKVVVDNILQSKKLPALLDGIVIGLFGQDKYAALNFAVASVAAIAIVGAVSSYFEKYLTTSVSQWVGHDLRRTLYHHIQRLSLAEHDESRTGDMITRVTSDIGAIQDFINSALLGILVSLMTLAGMIAVMFYLNWRFTLVALSVVPALFLLVYRYTRRIKKASRAVRTQEGALLSIVEEVLTSIRVVQAFAREDYEQRRFDSESLANVEAGLQARSIKAKLSPLVEVIVAIGTCLVLGYGARLALAGQLSAGVLIVFLLYLGKMYKPMRDLSKMTDTVSKAMVGYERIQEVLEIESRVRDVAGGGPAAPPPDLRPPPPPPPPPAPAQGSNRVRPRQLQLRKRQTDTRRRQLQDRSRAGRGDRGALRHREDDARELDSSFLRSRFRTCPN